jgi:hypothetical protein
MEELLAYIKPAIAVIPVSKSGAAIAATAVDARGYARAAFLFLTGAMGTGAVVTCSVTESASSGGTYAQKSTTAALTNLAAATGLNKLYAIDVPVNSSKPYLKLYGTCATAAVLHGAICLLYRGVNSVDPNLDTVLSQYVRKI